MPVHPYAMAKALCFQVFSVQLEGKGYKLAPTFADKHVNLLLDYKHDAVIIVWLNQTGIPLKRPIYTNRTAVNDYFTHFMGRRREKQIFILV